VNRGTFVDCKGQGLAVFRLSDPERVLVIDDACHHAGGSLSRGEVNGNTVTCPWHYWEFDLQTGRSTHSEHARVRCYTAEVRGGIVWVDLPEQGAERRAGARFP
jgi:nitrite reductase/ring-hydroxylating ferredoxin subunit